MMVAAMAAMKVPPILSQYDVNRKTKFFLMEVEGNGEKKNNDGDRSEVSGEKMRKKMDVEWRQ